MELSTENVDNIRGRDMKKSVMLKETPLAKQHGALIVPVSNVQTYEFHDLRQPDFRPLTNGVVSGGAGQLPVETWSTHYAELGRSSK